MQRFSRIKVCGYRSLVDVDLPLRPLAVMIGPNGSGRTSLLDLFLLLKQAMKAGLTKTIEQEGGSTLLPRAQYLGRVWWTLSCTSMRKVSAEKRR